MTPPSHPPHLPEVTPEDMGDDKADRPGVSDPQPLAAKDRQAAPAAADGPYAPRSAPQSMADSMAPANPSPAPGESPMPESAVAPDHPLSPTADAPPVSSVSAMGIESGSGTETGGSADVGVSNRDGAAGGPQQAPANSAAADTGFFAPQMLRGRALTLAAAVCGAVIFVTFGLPLPLLLGPMIGCLIFALAGAPLRGMGVFGIFMRTFLGVAIGATVTPDLIRAMPGHITTLALVPLFILVIGGIGYPFFRKVMGFDHATAFYSAMPGGLQDMLIFGEEAGGDVRAMSLAHATRVLVIVTAAPILLQVFYGADLTRPPGVHIGDVPLHELALMLLAGLGGWQLAERVHLFGASILGPLIATACLSLAGLIHQRPPAEVIWAAQFFIGIAVGAKYAGITHRELRVYVGAGVAFSLLLAVISIGFIEVAIHLSSAPPLDLMLSFLPGGQGEMAVIAIVTGADVAFVVTHHLTRIFLVIIIAPIIGRWAQRRSARRTF